MGTKKYLTEVDFDSHPIWKWDDRDDSFRPISSPNDFPELARDIYLKAYFVTPKKTELKGYIIGVWRVFSMGIFINGKQYIFNYNLPARANSHLDDLILKRIVTNKDELFPLKYKTDIAQAGMTDFSGTFDVFNKELCKNDHSDKQIY